MEKIKMTTPLVEMDGDEMTRILWKMIKDELLLPYIDLNTEYYDLGLAHRNETDDQVTVDSAEAAKQYGVAVKCATITPNAARMKEYDLKEMWKSPNGTIRAILDGTVFRSPILIRGIVPYVANWTKPITIARHAYGDVYKNVEIKVPGKGKAELVYTAEESFRESTIQKSPSQALREPALIMRWTRNRTCGLRPRIPSPKSMTIRLRTFSRRFMMRIIRKSLSSWESSISTR